MITLGIDPSTKTGVAVIIDGELIEAVEIKAKAGIVGMERVIYISKTVLRYVTKYKPDAICIEGYGYSNAHTLVTLVEIGTAIRLLLYKYQQKYIDVPPTSLKKFTTGKGNAKKDVMILEVYKRWGFEITNDNIADAAALAQFARAYHDDIKMPLVNLSAVENMKANLLAKTKTKRKAKK